MTSEWTPARRKPPLADPARFVAESNTSRSVILLFGGSLLLGGFLAAVPREIPGMAVATVLGGAWLSLVLAMTLPTRSERAGAELVRRIGHFRDRVNAVGDEPTRASLEDLLQLARQLELRDDEVGEELAQVRAAIAAIDLAAQVSRGNLPVVAALDPVPGGEVCHFSAPVRFGRRRSDQFGHLLLTPHWLKFRGVMDVSVAWSEISGVERAGRELIVSLAESRRVLRFACHSLTEAACGGVLAEHLSARARAEAASAHAPAYPAAV